MPDFTLAPDGLSWVPQETREAVRDAIRDRLQHSSAEAAVDAALRKLTRDARSCSVRAEHVVIALKQLWSTLPDVPEGTDLTDRNRLLERIITFSIREYYTQ